MKKYISTILFLFVFSVNAQDFSQLSLMRFMEKSAQTKFDDPLKTAGHLLDIELYMSARCSAFSGWMSGKASLGNTENEKKLANVHLSRSTEFSIIASEFHALKNDTDSKTSYSNILKTILKMVDNYSADSKLMYAKTASYLEGYIKEDMKICTEEYKNIEKTISKLEKLRVMLK